MENSVWMIVEYNGEALAVVTGLIIMIAVAITIVMSVIRSFGGRS